MPPATVTFRRTRREFCYRLYSIYRLHSAFTIAAGFDAYRQAPRTDDYASPLPDRRLDRVHSYRHTATHERDARPQAEMPTRCARRTG